MTDLLAPPALDSVDSALVDLLARLKASDYAFVTPTPTTHQRVSARLPQARAGHLRDIFGWGRPFQLSALEPGLLDCLQRADGLVPDGVLHRSRLRVSTLDGRLHLQSSRGSEADSVFLGPDSYRFVHLLDAILREGPSPERVLDIGAGAGAGALSLAARLQTATVVASDINPRALRLLAANAAHARLTVEVVEGSGLDAAAGDFDLITANPPYVAGAGGRTYRDGGGSLGADLALGWVEQGLSRLRPGGRFVLYTGSPIVEGRDLLQGELARLAGAAGASLSYEELDPDIFGGMLRQTAYREVERIAAVGAVLMR